MPKVTHPKAHINLGQKTRDGKFKYLRLVFRWNQNRLIYSLNHYLSSPSVQPKYWDSKKGETIYNKKYGQSYIDLNKELKEIKEHIETLYNANSEITLDELRLELDYFTEKKERPTSSGDKKLSLFNFIDWYIKSIQINGKRGTWKKFITVQNHLINFATEKKINLDYNLIHWKFRSDFLQWLYASPRNHATNNAAKTFEVLKQFLQESSKLEYHNNKIYLEKGFGVQRVKTQKTFPFPFSELDIIRKYDLSDNLRLDKVRDLFIVGCYTGLRFSDWDKVKLENIIIQKNGKKKIKVRTKKTDKDVTIPCRPELLEILEKYDYQLPPITNQKFNTYIKEVIKLIIPNSVVKITYSKSNTLHNEVFQKHEKVASHCCRKSFATNFYQLGIKPALIMQITGHSTEKQFFEYVNISGDESADEFDAQVEKLKSKRILKIAK